MPGPNVITIGNFDGVHLGHRSLLARARHVADQASARVVALAFDPSPQVILRPGQEPLRLIDLDAKARLLRDAGADEVRVLTPTVELLAQPPEAFVASLVEAFAPCAIVEGPDFRFGHARRGDNDLLARLGRAAGFAVHVVPPTFAALPDQSLVPVRSSLVRWLLRHGRVLDAGVCLGRAFDLAGVVVRGEQRGRTIGVPTANLDLAAFQGRALPADGVYSGVARLPGGAEFSAAISLGAKPTFRGTQRVLEAHLLGFSGDLYGQSITLSFSRWLRDQRPFPNLQSLRDQLARDLDQAGRLSQLDPPAWSRSAPGSAAADTPPPRA